MRVYLALLGDRETILKSPLNIPLSKTYINKSNFTPGAMPSSLEFGITVENLTFLSNLEQTKHLSPLVSIISHLNPLALKSYF